MLLLRVTKTVQHLYTALAAVTTCSQLRLNIPAGNLFGNCELFEYIIFLKFTFVSKPKSFCRRLSRPQNFSTSNLISSFSTAHMIIHYNLFHMHFEIVTLSIENCNCPGCKMANYLNIFCVKIVPPLNCSQDLISSWSVSTL